MINSCCTVIQLDSLFTVQGVFDPTLTVAGSPSDDTFTREGVTVSLGVAPACVTVTVRDAAPAGVTVTFPLLVTVDGLGATFISIEPLFDPLGGDAVSQFESLLTLHVVFDVTVAFTGPPAGDTLKEVGATVRFGAAGVLNLI